MQLVGNNEGLCYIGVGVMQGVYSHIPYEPPVRSLTCCSKAATAERRALTQKLHACSSEGFTWRVRGLGLGFRVLGFRIVG